MFSTPDQPQCNGKNRYSKKHAAKTKQFVGEKRGKNMRTYYCNRCYGWHITKKDYE